MERRRLKTAMILILALLNLFLAVHLAGLWALEEAARRLSEEQIAALFEEGGVTLSPGAISRKSLPSGCGLERDEALGGSLAAFFLPDGTQERREEDGTRVWTDADGGVTVRLTSSGAFTVTGLTDSGMEQCGRFCRQFGYEAPQGDGEGICIVKALYNRLEVCNCQAVFTFRDGDWQTAAGTLIPRRTVPFSRDVHLLSAAAALSAFLSYQLENHAVVSSVNGMEQCCVLRSGEEAALEPVWRILTDTVDYYVNGVDGTIFLM